VKNGRAKTIKSYISIKHK